MDSKAYDKTWEEAILPAIKCIYDECAGEGNIYSFKECDLERLKSKVFKDYDVIRSHLKDRYYQTDGSDESLIDTHKIAACLCYSLIKNKPFSFRIEMDMSQHIFVSNYAVAYYSSVGFVYMTLIAEYMFNGYPEFAKKLQENGKFIEPPVSKGHNEYAEGRIYALAQNDLYGNTFDILGYADMMYWIELYNRQMVENTVTPVDLDRMKE